MIKSLIGSFEYNHICTFEKIFGIIKYGKSKLKISIYGIRKYEYQFCILAKVILLIKSRLLKNNCTLNYIHFPIWNKIVHSYFVSSKERLIFALSILHEQTTAKARSKLVG